MKTSNLKYFNRYVIRPELILLLICCFAVSACETRRPHTTTAAESGKLAPETAVNLNTASAAELEKLPQIGEKTAQKIVAFRQKYGNFRKPEHLLLVPGISDEKFRRIKNSVVTE